jgi:hypothetical protein
MMPKNGSETPEIPDWEEIVNEIREDPQLAEEFARQEGSRGWRPKEVSVGASPWLVRGMILFLLLALVVEMVVLAPASHNASPQSAQVTDGASAQEVFRKRLPTPTIAPPPPTATALPPEPVVDPSPFDKSF